MPHPSGTIRIFLAGLLVAACLSTLLTAAAQNGAGALGIVTVEGGQLQGIPTDVPGVTLFKGIPFAATTAGDNRFRAPQRVEPWEGVRAANTWGDRSMQWSGINPVGGFYGDEFYYDPEFLPPISEKGLNLNVFTPAEGSDANLPVYMWIHGGANAHGYASEIEFWAPKLAAKGIVLVAVQYRLGPFGDLSLAEIQDEDPNGVAGNQRLLDLVKALEWIRDNIAGFGGDPNTVTIGGQSAGGSNTVSLLRTPLARGLFQRAIVQSSFSALLGGTYMTPEEADAKNSEALEELFGEPMSLADLRAIAAEDFFSRTVDDDGTLLYYAMRSATGGQVVDGVSLTEESVDLLRPGALDGIDLMIGSVADEGTSTRGNPDGTMDMDEYASSMAHDYGDQWEKAYPASDPQHAYRLSLRSFADRTHAAALVSADYVKRNSPDANVYVYYFDNPPPGRNAGYYGAFHSSELWYFMNSMRDWRGQRPWTQMDYRLAETISTYVANFVKTGSPNGEGLPVWDAVEDGTEFVRFADGNAYPVESTPYPLRDRLNREAVLRENGLE